MVRPTIKSHKDLIKARNDDCCCGLIFCADSFALPLANLFTNFRLAYGVTETAMDTPKIGRPRLREDVKQNLTIRVSPLLRQFLNTRGNSIAVYVEDLVRETREFKAWRKTQP